VGEKTIKNRVGTLRLAWKWARDWGYTRAPFPETLRLPYWDREEAKARRPAYSMDTVKQIMESSEFPYNLIWWLTTETHIRRGEVCGLDVGHVSLKTRIITIRRNRVLKSVVKNTKSRKPRTFSISDELAEALRPLVEGRGSNEPLFLSPDGKRLHPENLVKRKLRPLLKELGVYVKGTACHGFRHGAATKLDELGTPMATRQQRMGHVDPDTLMGYTHAVTDEDRKVSAAFGAVLSHAFSRNEPAKEIPEQLSLQLTDSDAAA
jgi:integrase